MSHSQKRSPTMYIDQVLHFVDGTTGLNVSRFSEGILEVSQDMDRFTASMDLNILEDVLVRTDSDNISFLQLNFKGGLKVLLTDQLIGFKPKPVVGLDLAKIPKVVTTPDLKSVEEALEDLMATDSSDYEVEILRKVYQAILGGAETAGFTLTEKREAFNRLAASKIRASA